MNAQLKRGFAVTYAAFASARNTVIAQLLIVILFSTLTIVGMTDVAKHENQKAISLGAQ